MYLQGKIRNLEGEGLINKIESSKSAAVAKEAKKEVDIAKFQTKKLSGVVSGLQRRLDRL